MSDDLIPPKDDKFDDFQAQAITTIAANPATYGHAPADVTALEAAQAAWNTKFAAHKVAVITGEQATKAKDKAREGLEDLLRASVRKVNAIPGADNALRASIALPAHATTRHKIAAPTTQPIVRIVELAGHRQELHWVDASTPTSRKKPAGYEAVEIFLKLGDPAPTDETTCTLAARDTATPYVYEFQTADVGKTAYWFVRWVNHANEHGPLSALVSAKVNP
jgi:hypothetical protein